MLELLAVGFVAGVIVGVSPCILPVLPAVLVASAPVSEEPPDGGSGTGEPTRVDRRGPLGRHARPVAIVAGLVISFSVLTLVGATVLRLLHLPEDLLMDLGLALLALLGAGLVIPWLGHQLERPFSRLPVASPSASLGGLWLGCALGAVFVPCAGPVLATISVLGATDRIGATVVLLTGAFALGSAVPLLVVALAGERLAGRVRALRTRVPALRLIAGIVLLATVVGIGSGALDPLQRDIPGYTSVLQHDVEGTSFARQSLGQLEGNGGGALASCVDDAPTLSRCGTAPALRDITAWINTPDDRPISLAGLRGDVVLVDFWTYSCINCQRTLPHLEAWYSRYHRDGFTIVGVHTPEFAFEHVVSNVRAAVHQFDIRYPVVVDDHDATWDAYQNEYWPAEYLVDAQGVVRHIDVGEGGYSQTEDFIRSLLRAAHPGIRLPPPTSVPDRTPTEVTTPESYLGTDRIDNLLGAAPVPGRFAPYRFPTSLPVNWLGVSGDLRFTPEYIATGSGARIELHYEAKDVYLVLGGRGTIQVTTPGSQPRTVVVSGVPRLYTLVSGTTATSQVLSLSLSPGIDAYDFTFG